MDLVTQQKLERREHILDAARLLIAEQGYDGLTMRDLAARCRVSVPTLYNQFGSKDGLLARAVASHFEGMLESFRRGRQRGHQRLLGLLELCADNMVRLPSYHRSLLRAFMNARDTRPLQAELMSDLSSEIERALDDMAERRQLAAWADRHVLARQLTGAAMAASVAWALGVLDDTRLPAVMVHAGAGMVLGPARGAAQTALLREVRRAQEVLAASEAPRAETG